MIDIKGTKIIFIAYMCIFNRNGVNGEQCIKKAICETMLIEMNNENNNENEPEYFLKEIFRVVFR